MENYTYEKCLAAMTPRTLKAIDDLADAARTLGTVEAYNEICYQIHQLIENPSLTESREYMLSMADIKCEANADLFMSNVKL